MILPRYRNGTLCIGIRRSNGVFYYAINITLTSLDFVLELVAASR